MNSVSYLDGSDENAKLRSWSDKDKNDDYDISTTDKFGDSVCGFLPCLSLLIAFFFSWDSARFIFSPGARRPALLTTLGFGVCLICHLVELKELKSNNKRYFFYLSLAKKTMLLLNNMLNVIVQSKEQPRFFQVCTQRFSKLLNSLFKSFQKNVWEKPQFEYFQDDRKFPEYLLKTVNIHLAVDRWWRGFSGWFFVKYYFIIWIVHAFSQLLEKFCGWIFD